VLTRITQQLGGSFGTATLAVILEHSISVSGSGNLVGAFQVSFWWATGFSVIALLLCLWLPGRKQIRAAAAVAKAAAEAAAPPATPAVRT
jgi:hypothetical protein